MTKKLDIMNNKDPGKWILQGEKVQKVEEFIPTAIVVEKEEKLEVKEKVEEVEKKPKKKIDIFKKKEWRKI